MDRRIKFATFLAIAMLAAAGVLAICSQIESESQEIRFVSEPDNAEHICTERTCVFVYTGEDCNTLKWNFGDGSVSEVRQPTHRYAGDGTYDVTCTAVSDYGSDTALYAMKLTVEEPSFLEQYGLAIALAAVSLISACCSGLALGGRI